MKDEIKEILEYLKCEEEYYDGLEEVVLSSDEKVIERGDIELLLDYITNLQEENKNLKQINEEHRELNGELRKENERLLKQLENSSLDEANIRADILLEQQDYKTRNEKAINCINHYATENDDYSKLYSIEEEELLEILQGKSDK